VGGGGGHGGVGVGVPGPLPGVDGEFDAAKRNIWFGGAEFEARPELGADCVDHYEGAEVGVEDA